jgi:ankyrin repeat protein
MPQLATFFEACAAGDVAALETYLGDDPTLATSCDAGGRTGLHHGHRHPDVVRVLLAHDADPDARETGDNVTPLHLAAASGAIDSVRLLLDAGADVHGSGDLHEGDVIGWAAGSRNQAVIDLLVERGAKHHVFSAMALRDRDLVRRVVADDPAALLRRRSRFENRQTAVHAAIVPADGIGLLCGKPDHDMLALLIELGADVNAVDDRGRTPLTLSMLRGDHEATRTLMAAGAVFDTSEAIAEPADVAASLSALSESVSHAEPMFTVRDLPTTIRWYEALGFACTDAYEEDGAVRFARLVFGRCSLALSPGDAPPRGVSLWVFTNRIDDIYSRVRARQVHAARSVLSGTPAGIEFRFDEDLYTPFYGGRQFSLRGPDDISVIFYSPGGSD